MKAIHSGAPNPKCFIKYNPIKVPVLPNPALQWMAMAPLQFSTASKNFLIMWELGTLPSVKYKSRCFIPAFSKSFLSYSGLFSLITSSTPHSLKREM